MPFWILTYIFLNQILFVCFIKGLHTCLISFNFGPQLCLEFASLCNDWPTNLTGTTQWTKPARACAHACAMCCILSTANSICCSSLYKGDKLYKCPLKYCALASLCCSNSALKPCRQQQCSSAQNDAWSHCLRLCVVILLVLSGAVQTSLPKAGCLQTFKLVFLQIMV